MPKKRIVPWSQIYGSKEGMARDHALHQEFNVPIVKRIQTIDLAIRHLKQTNGSLDAKDRVQIVNDVRKHLTIVRASGEVGAEEAKRLRTKLKEALGRN